MHEVLVNRLGGLSLPRKSVVRLTDRPDMTLDVYGGRKTTMQQKSPSFSKGIIDRTGAQTMLYLTCTTITSVDLAHYGVSRVKDWESVDCGTRGP